MEMVPFVIFADFESFINPNSEPSSSDSNSAKVAKHTPSGFNWTCIDHRGKIIRKRTYHAEQDSENIGQIFLLDLLSPAEDLNRKVSIFEFCAREQMLLPNHLPQPLKCFFAHKIIKKKIKS